MLPRQMASALLSFGLIFCLWSAAFAAEPAFTFADGVLTIRTERYEVAWRDGCMVRLRSVLPQAGEFTLPTMPMAAGQLPNGLGSFHGQDKEGKEQHFPWRFAPLSTAFPAQHPPAAETKVAFEKSGNTARLTYSGLKDEPSASLVQELAVEAGTGDLVIRQEGRSANPGVFGVAFSALNLRPDVQFLVPYFGGQRWGKEFAAEKLVTIAWPEFWTAGLVVGESPSGGTFAVWADDPKMRPKFLHWYHGQDVQGIGFEACNDAPYDDTREVKAFNWRFNTFANWMEPAQRYKDWMRTTHRLVPRKERPSKWVDEIALIWPYWPSEEPMKKMAELLDPKRILIHQWGWLKGFNRRIPEYIPQSKDAAEHAALAHRYGFRVGIYTSMALVDVETHPTIMKDYGLEFFYRGLYQDKPTEAKGWLVYVHPGSPKWREFYANRMAEVHAKYGVDYFYQDVAGCAIGSSGIVDGKTFSAAVVACEAAIRAKAPQAAIGGEFWTEVNACQEDFGIGSFLSWGGQEQPGGHKDFISRPDQPHPLLSYLFSDYCVYWPHVTTIRDTRRFHNDQNINEVIGAIPVWTTTPDDRVSEARAVLERAKLWADGFRPHFPKSWTPKAVSYMRNPSGRVVKYVRDGGSTYCYEEAAGGDKLKYARLTGVGSVTVSVPVTIDGWLAYSPQGPIGLDPSQWYCAFPGPPDDVPILLTRLPPGASVTGTRVTDDYVLVQLDGSSEGEVRWQAKKPFLSLSTPASRLDASAKQVAVKLPTSLLFAFVKPEPLRLPARLPLDKWPHATISSGRTVGKESARRHGKFTIGDVMHEGCMVRPPLGGKGSEHSIDGLLSLPATPKAALKMSLGLPGSIGDGVHFVVRVNGKEIWRQYRETKPGWEDVTVPLADHAGQDVVLSLALDCGKNGHNTSCDDSVWGEVEIVEKP